MATLEDLIRQKQELEKEIEEVTRRERINALIPAVNCPEI